jgi:hypothetical protein
MECSICYKDDAKYTIQCGSTVPHTICFSCEREWRLKSKPTYHGRVLICPFCRKEEVEAGCRSRSSYEAELALLYQEFYERPPSPPYVPPRRPLEWCANRSTGCPTGSKTSRKCSYPAGCVQHVCRNCKMCISHFQPESPREIYD